MFEIKSLILRNVKAYIHKRNKVERPRSTVSENTRTNIVLSCMNEDLFALFA